MVYTKCSCSRPVGAVVYVCFVVFIYWSMDFSTTSSYIVGYACIMITFSTSLILSSSFIRSSFQSVCKEMKKKFKHVGGMWDDHWVYTTKVVLFVFNLKVRSWPFYWLLQSYSFHSALLVLFFNHCVKSNVNDVDLPCIS